MICIGIIYNVSHNIECYNSIIQDVLFLIIQYDLINWFIQFDLYDILYDYIDNILII